MNTAALEKFAPAVRNRLIEAVDRKLDFVLSQQTPDLRTTYARQVRELRELERQGRQALLERVAYTWFNRLVALRFLDARGWHPFHAKVLMPATPGETLPELLSAFRQGHLAEELKGFTKSARLEQLLRGEIPSDDAQGEVYRELVLAASRYYHRLLPDVFERLDDETELLLPDDLLTGQSVVQGFRTEISDGDCETVEVIGWLYQFYISEKKDAVMKRKAAVPSEDIPAVTQLFTPHWIVRYLVENSVGRLWLLNRPTSGLRAHMPYYIEREAETEFLRIEKPQDIKVLDPAVGSGHMLTYAFDLLFAIYEEEGYAASEIPALILANNLHGLDICPRAAQLAEMALVFKAREKARRWFLVGDVKPMVMALQDVAFGDEELREYVGELKLARVFTQPVMKLLGQFEQATTFGSLIQPCVDEATVAGVLAEVERKEVGGGLFLRETHGRVVRVLRQAEMLGQRYSVVLANPPYMGRQSMSPPVSSFLDERYRDGKSDLMTAFMVRHPGICQHFGFFACVTLDSWMFLSSYADLRSSLLSRGSIESLLHIGWNCFPYGHVYNRGVAFVVTNGTDKKSASQYVSLSDVPATVNKETLFLERLSARESFYSVAHKDFTKVPGFPIAYWISDQMRGVYEKADVLGDHVRTAIGLNTGDNSRFLRQWSEVGIGNLEFHCRSSTEAARSGKKWFPYNKGGAFRKWFGNRDFVINWEHDGQEVKDYAVERNHGKHWSRYIQNLPFMFRKGVTWTFISSSCFGVRSLEAGSLFDVAGSGAFSDTLDSRLVLGFLCSKVAFEYLKALNPTLNFQAGNLSSLPLFETAVCGQIDSICRSVDEMIDLARTDWDNNETSWDFTSFPLLRPGTRATTLAASWSAYSAACTTALTTMQALETENNRLFIAAYGLESELTPEVPLDQITLARADTKKDMAAFLSYAVGCMMGRYSLDRPGLILADAGDTLENYLAKVAKPLHSLTFAPDADGIIPVLDGDWFPDDIVARTREFLRATFGAATLRENLQFLESSLGRDLRSYFTTDFYKNHLQTYKKRPIYWLVQSPKKSFACLLYLHRYTRDTFNVVLNSYLREYLSKIRARLAHLAQLQLNPSTSTADKTAARREHDKLQKALRECEDWEREVLLPLAQQRIDIDLDDGVKVNYLKFGAALAPIAGLAAAEED